MRHNARKGDKDRLSDILVAIEKAAGYAARGRKAFDEDELLRSGIVLQLLVIGEAASGLSPEVREGHPEAPWREIIDMRNTMIHGYSYIDFEIVWRVVERDLGQLRVQIRAILDQLD